LHCAPLHFPSWELDAPIIVHSLYAHQSLDSLLSMKLYEGHCDVWYIYTADYHSESLAKLPGCSRTFFPCLTTSMPSTASPITTCCISSHNGYHVHLFKLQASSFKLQGLTRPDFEFVFPNIWHTSSNGILLLMHRIRTVGYSNSPHSRTFDAAYTPSRCNWTSYQCLR